MSNPWVLIAAILALAGLYVLLPVAAHTFRRFRSLRRISCPEVAARAAVAVDARRAALTSAFGRPELRVKDCSLWPEREGCGQGCLRHLQR